ncbi:MAG: CHAP domain-containing protein [Clostridiales bacterium]|nr:CHAP domain-containing protein [Candidatus Blautia equi]
MKKALSVLLAMALMFSLCNPVFAASSVVSSGSKTTHKYDLNNQNELNEYIRLYGNKAQNSKAAIAAAARTISPAPSADTLLQLAESQVGGSGRPNEYTWWFGSIDGTYSYAWCHAFISWVAEKCGAADIIPKTVSCIDGVKWFKDRGRWHPSGVGYTPMKGDVVYFDWDANGTYDHVGFVALESNAILYTIEGNSNDAVRKRVIACTAKKF